MTTPPLERSSPYDGIDPSARTSALIVALLCAFNLLLEELVFFLASNGTIGISLVALARPLPYIALGVTLFVIGRTRGRRVAASVGTIGLGLVLGLYTLSLPHLAVHHGLLNALSWIIPAVVPALLVLYWGIARRDGTAWLAGVAWAAGYGLIARMFFGAVPPLSDQVLYILVENVLYTAPAVIGGVIAWRRDQPSRWA